MEIARFPRNKLKAPTYIQHWCSTPLCGISGVRESLEKAIATGSLSDNLRAEKKALQRAANILPEHPELPNSQIVFLTDAKSVHNLPHIWRAADVDYRRTRFPCVEYTQSCRTYGEQHTRMVGEQGYNRAGTGCARLIQVTDCRFR